MLTYELERGSTIPLYEQLYLLICSDLRSGAIRSGEKLPSKRLLAEHLGVSRITVEAAYQQLCAEGWVIAKERSGYFAESLLPHSVSPYQPMKPHAVEKKPDSAARQFPASVWARLTRKVLLDYRDTILCPIPNAGLLELRSAIAAELLRSRGLSVTPEQILIGSGTEYFYNILIQLLGRDRVYGLESPGHTKIAAVCKANGVAVEPIVLDKHGMQLQAVAAGSADILYLSPSHQFPSGVVMPVRRRQELLRWAAEKERRYLIEDDYDAEFRFSGKPIAAMAGMDPGKVIYLNTFSKTLAPSLRISYMVLPTQLMEEYRNRLGFYSCSVPALEQMTLALFLSEGHFERHLNRMRKHYRRILACLCSTLAAAGGERVSIYSGDGLHFVMLVRNAPDSLPGQLSLFGLSTARVCDYEIGTDYCSRDTFVLDFSALEESAVPLIGNALRTALN